MALPLKNLILDLLQSPVNELINEYNKVFGSGLVMPPSKPTLQTSAPSGNHGFVKI